MLIVQVVMAAFIDIVVVYVLVDDSISVCSAVV